MSQKVPHFDDVCRENVFLPSATGITSFELLSFEFGLSSVIAPSPERDSQRMYLCRVCYHPCSAQHEQGDRKRNHPEKSLRRVCIAYISCIHTQIARYEREREENDGYGGEYEDGLVV